MSSGGRSHTAPRPPTTASPVSLPRLNEMKANGEPIVMVTAYDYPSATVAEAAGVDVVLVGDSAANVVLGYPDTELVSMEEMLVLGKAVRRGLKTPLMVGDMPMGSYEASNEEAIRSAQRLIKETGCQAVKLEAGGVIVERARAIVQSGIPVMGHVGLTPQTATALGGYKAQGKTPKSAIKLLEDALALQSVGCFAIVIEAVPSAITDEIVERARGADDRHRRRPRRPPARSSSSTTCSGSPPATWRNSSSATPTSTRRWSPRSSATATRSAAATSPSPTTSTASSRPSSTSSAATSARRAWPGQGLGVGAAALSGDACFGPAEAGVARVEGADPAEDAWKCGPVSGSGPLPRQPDAQGAGPGCGGAPFAGPR